MTQEEKHILLADLCARLVYNPFCKIDGIGSPVKLIRVEVDTVDGILLDFDYEDEQGLPLQVYLSEVKPYLRPMSSMTEEEINEFHKLRFIHINYGLEPLQCVLSVNEIDWLNAHYFDFRGLIPMGFALKAPEGMYN